MSDATIFYILGGLLGRDGGGDQLYRPALRVLPGQLRGR